MRTLTTILAGAAALALSGAAVAYAADGSHIHRLTIQLPGGGVEHIEYTGNVRPNVTIVPAMQADNPFAVRAVAPDPFFAGFGGAPMFASFDRIAAAMDAMQARMDRNIALMMRDARSLDGANAPIAASFGTMPPGSESYSFVSTMNGGKFCSRMVEVTKTGNAKPNVVTKTSGDCGPASASSSAHVSVPKSAI